jgi:hypothetical protein
MNKKAIQDVSCRSVQCWMSGWTTKATSQKSHTVTCKSNEDKRRWKLTVFDEEEQPPRKAKRVGDNELDVLNAD